MNAVGNFFKAINSTLNEYVDYVDSRVWSGKFVGDIRYKLNQSYITIWKALVHIGRVLKRSHIFYPLGIVFLPIWKILLRITLFKNVVSLFIDAVKIIGIFYAEIFIIFSMTFPTSILLVNLFQESIILFFIVLLPILFWNIFVVSALYFYIAKRTAGDKLSLWHSFMVILKKFGKYSFSATVSAAILLEGIVGFFVLTLFLTYVFSFIQTSWNISFLYWFLIIFSGLFVFSILFAATIILHQTYFAVLLDNLSFHEALDQSKKHIKQYIPQYLCFYFLFFLYSSLFIARATISYLYLGLIISVFYTVAAGVFLGFLLRRIFFVKQSEQALTTNKKTHSSMLFVAIVVFGLINYVLVARVVIRDYQPILTFVQQQQDNFLAAQKAKKYTNNTYHYTLSYPQNWSIYEWNANAVTFYNNYTGTISGGTWLSIRVTPYNANAFTYLSQATPGIVSYDPQSKNVTTKVSNFILQTYEGVNYTTVKSSIPYTQYETHYVIHRDGYLYDMAFTSLANDVGGYNSELFDKVVSSFQFIQ